MQSTELYKCLFLMTLGIVTLNVTIVADYIASSSKSTFPIGAMVGGLIGGLALILAMVALYLFKPIIFNPYVKRKNNCSRPLSPL